MWFACLLPTIQVFYSDRLCGSWWLTVWFLVTDCVVLGDCSSVLWRPTAWMFDDCDFCSL